jgi:hypothetical protein
MREVSVHTPARGTDLAAALMLLLVLLCCSSAAAAAAILPWPCWCYFSLLLLLPLLCSFVLLLHERI